MMVRATFPDSLDELIRNVQTDAEGTGVKA